MKIVNVVGARPNFMKIAPIIEALKDKGDVDSLLVHTGQHYDQKMSHAFFEDLGLPRPDIDLGVGSGSHAGQTAAVMVEFERVLLKENPDWVVVVGDVNSTMACAITAKKLGVRVAHVEAGLRSGDMTMPEEINRLCTDAISDALFTTDCFADQNLAREGVPSWKIHFVGNVMIDTLLKHRDKAKENGTYARFGLESGKYIAMTMHRPGNVDDPAVLEGILSALERVSRDIPILFPIHPRTAKMIDRFGLSGYIAAHDGNGLKPRSGVWTSEPLGYLDFLNLNMNSGMVVTDSGGLQEETTMLGIPCVTMRPNTERPVTCEMGTNVLVGNDPAKIEEAVRARLATPFLECTIPPLWDGRAAKRIVSKLMELGGC